MFDSKFGKKDDNDDKRKKKLKFSAVMERGTIRAARRGSESKGKV